MKLSQISRTALMATVMLKPQFLRLTAPQAEKCLPLSLRMTAILFPRISETGHEAFPPHTLCSKFSQAAPRLRNWTMVLAIPRFCRHTG